MWYVVELGDDTVPVVGSCKAVGLMHVSAEMHTKEEKWMASTDEGGANKNLEFFIIS